MWSPVLNLESTKCKQARGKKTPEESPPRNSKGPDIKLLGGSMFGAAQCDKLLSQPAFCLSIHLGPLQVAQKIVAKKNVSESKRLELVYGTVLSPFHVSSGEHFSGVGWLLQYLCLVKKENEAWRHFVEDTQIFLVGIQVCCSRT